MNQTRKVAARTAAIAVLALAAAAAPARTQTTTLSLDLVEQGRTAFTAAICSACHSVAPGAPSGAGPNLFGVFGRDIGSLAGFNYSAALAAYMPGQTWTAELLNQWLASPSAMVPGTTMGISVPDEPRRTAIVAYLMSLVPPPAP